MSFARETLNKYLRGRIAALRGAGSGITRYTHEPAPQLRCRNLACLQDMWLRHNLKVSLRRNPFSRFLRAVRLALHPARRLVQRFLRSAFLLLAVLALSACSSTDSDKAVEKPAALVKFTPSAKVVVRWRQQVGSPGLNPLRPAIQGGVVYAANARGELVALDAQNGRRLWQAKAGFPVAAGVGIGAGKLLLGGKKGEVAAFDLDGKPLWSSRVSSEVIGAPHIADDIVVVRSGDGRIAALNARDGSRLWLYERATPALVARSHAAVTIRDGMVFAGFPAGKLAAINLKNGVLVWESSVSQPRGITELERISDITSLPLVDDGRVCAVAFQGRLACFDEDRGSPLWTREFSSELGMALSRRYLFLTDSQGTVIALDKVSGSTVWKNEQLRLRGVSAPYASEKYVAVGDAEGYLHVLNREDGSLMARHHSGSAPLWLAPMELNEGLLLVSGSGDLYSVAVH